MRAPVYRNIEAPNTLLGLSFPTEVSVVALGFWVAMTTLPLLPGLACTLASYVGVRLSSYGRPPLFLQHFLIWRMRHAVSSGLLSAAARYRSPSFPFVPTASQVRPTRSRNG